MLEELRIRGLGVIDDAVLPLGPGLTVVTGETGAGKTMVVSGLLLLFGARAESDRVRTGADQASVEGRLVVDADSPVAERVRAAGGELDDGTGLVLRRVVSAAGRSRAYVGGTGAPVAVLAELAELLYAVHGQADQHRLSRPVEQRALLDRYAELDLAEYSQAYRDWRDAQGRLAQRLEHAAELRRESELLAAGLAEIEHIAPLDGEDVELAALVQRLAHADALHLAALTAHDALLGDSEAPMADASDVAQLLAGAARGLGQVAGADPELDGLAERLADLAALAQDLGAELRGYADAVDADPAHLEVAQQRRAQLAALVRRYGDGPDPNLDAVQRWAQHAAGRLAEIDVSDEAIAALAADQDRTAARAATLATAITAARHAAAERLSREVTAELAGLAMAESAVIVEVRDRGGDRELGPDGADEVEFLLRAHPDSPALALARSASGGEMSRVMLALEVCLAGADPVPIMVFDEVDAGVGGRAAGEVGRRLARLAADRQVIVVTHLAQVAAFADRHIVVDRPARAGREVVSSDVRSVSGGDRVSELARMLAGTESGTALEHAAELLAAAAEERVRYRNPANTGR